MSVSAPVLVAVVADGGAVTIAGDVRVGIVGAGLLVRGGSVAVDASEARVVGGNLVAVVANRTVMRNREVSMVECCAQPSGGSVASVAGRGITGGNVIGDAAAERLRAGPCGLVAAIAGSVRGCQRVVAIDVASRARSFAGVGVCAGERPSGGGVVKFSVGPIQSVVTGRALRSGKACGDVVGHAAAKRLATDPGGLVAAVAIGVGGGEIVIVADVAIGAGGNFPGGSQLVRAGEWPAGGAVVEDGGGPGNRVVARGTI